MLINKLLPLILSLVLILSLFVGCRSTNDGISSSDISTSSSEEFVVDNSSEDEIDDNSSLDSELSGEEVSSDDSSSDSTSQDVSSDNTVSVGDSDNDAEPDAPPTYVEPSEGEGSGTGSTDNSNQNDDVYNGVTLVTSPNYKTGNVVTVKIASNGSVFYKIRGVSNKILTINSANAYVVYNNKKYEAKNGVLSFVVESNELASAQILFEIGNKGSAAESFTVNFASPKGSWDNKEKIEIIDKEINSAISEGEEAGYWYQYTATKAGSIKFYILSGTDTGVLSVTNNSNSAQRSTDIEDELKADSTGKYIELTGVKDGDKIDINLAAKSSGSQRYPAVTIKWMIVCE